MASVQLQQLFQSLPAEDRSRALQEAGLREIDRDIFEGLEAERLLRGIMRVRLLSNETFASIVREAEMVSESRTAVLQKDGLKELTATFVFASADSGKGVPISDVVASSAISWEVAARVAAVYRELARVNRRV